MIPPTDEVDAKLYIAEVVASGGGGNDARAQRLGDVDHCAHDLGDQLPDIHV